MATRNTIEQHETYPSQNIQAVKSDIDLKADVSSKGSMEIGTSITIPILAREEWNNTQIRLMAGEEHHFTASGQWVDWFTVCDADGWSYSGLLSPLNLLLEATKCSRRVPEERLFTLIGSIDQKAPYFGIGVEARIAPQSTGTLYCFANDISFMYWHNWGTIQLTSTRTR